MKKCVVPLVLLVSLVGFEAESQLPKTELRSLTQVRILVEELPHPAQDFGLTRSWLHSQALVLVKRSIPQLLVRDDALPMLYVNINVLPIRTEELGAQLGYTASVEVALQRPATILSDDGFSQLTTSMATVWHTDMLITGPRGQLRSQVQDVLEGLLIDFAAEYYKANP